MGEQFEGVLVRQLPKVLWDKCKHPQISVSHAQEPLVGNFQARVSCNRLKDWSQVSIRAASQPFGRLVGIAAIRQYGPLAASRKTKGSFSHTFRHDHVGSRKHWMLICPWWATSANHHLNEMANLVAGWGSFGQGLAWVLSFAPRTLRLGAPENKEQRTDQQPSRESQTPSNQVEQGKEAIKQATKHGRLQLTKQTVSDECNQATHTHTHHSAH